MRKSAVVFATVSMFLSIAPVAHAGVFPFADGYTASYTATQSSTTWNCEIQFVGTETLPPGPSLSRSYLWTTMQMTNWNGDGTNPSMYVRVTGQNANAPDTANTLYQFDVNQPAAPTPYSIPLFKPGPSTWTYKDTNGNNVTATVVSHGTVMVPAGTYKNVYGVHYVAVNGESVTQQDEVMYWQEGVGLIKDVDSSPPLSSPITRQLTSPPFSEVLVGTWTGNMEIVIPGTSAVEKGTVTVVFDQVTNTTQAYTGTLTWTPAEGSAGSQFTLNFSAIRGPWDATSVHITAQDNVILGEMRTQAGSWVLDLHGSDVSSNGFTYVSVGLIKE